MQPSVDLYSLLCSASYNYTRVGRKRLFFCAGCATSLLGVLLLLVVLTGNHSSRGALVLLLLEWGVALVIAVERMDVLIASLSLMSLYLSLYL